MNNKNAKNEISLMYIFFCAFLIVTNIISSTMPEISGRSFAYRVINTIQILIACGIHGFVFAEGYKAGIRTEALSFKKLFVKLKRVIVPFVSAIIVYWLFLVLLNEAEVKPIALVKIALNYHFYIVLVILQFILISQIMPRLGNKINVFVGIAVALIISLLSVTCIPTKIHKVLFTTYLICYMTGFFAGKNREEVTEFVKTDFVKILFVYVISLIITESISIIYAFSSNVPVVVMKQIATGMYTPVAVIFVMALCMKLSQKDFCEQKSFLVLRKTEYHIFLWHLLPIEVCSLALVESEIILKVGGVLIKTVSTILVMLLVYWIFHVKERNNNGTV